MITLILSAIVALIVTTIALLPWVVEHSPSPARGPKERLDELQYLKERLLQSIRDLDLDFHTGKIAEGDYTSGRENISHELQRVYAEMDSIVSNVSLNAS